MIYVRDFLVLFSGFVRSKKININGNVSITDHASGIRLPDCYKLAMNYKNSGRVLLVKFSYWFKFQVNISTGSRVTTIFVYKGLTRNSEIGNTPV